MADIVKPATQYPALVVHVIALEVVIELGWHAVQTVEPMINYIVIGRADHRAHVCLDHDWVLLHGQ